MRQIENKSVIKSPGFSRLHQTRYCLLGLPVDNISLSDTKQLIHEQAPLKSSIILSTINVNWVVTALHDILFRNAIIHSDLVTIDGKPLLWLSKLLGYPMSETVPGSTLIQDLHKEKLIRPITIFLFGGDGHAAKTAMKKVNKQIRGLKVVGAINPGYGSVEEMSADKIINEINKSSPDILLVALGARKGVEWIEKNYKLINAGIISHLGATINFLGGTVKRAPYLMQICGLEWLWRIYQEPKLFFRYANDGLKLSYLLLQKFPLWYHYWRLTVHFRNISGDELSQWHENSTQIILSLGKCLRAKPGSPLREQLRKAACANKDITIDFKCTEYVDGTFLGLILTIQGIISQNGYQIKYIGVSKRLAKILNFFCMQEIYIGTTT